MDYDRVGRNPLFKQLSFERNCLGGCLAITMIAVYFSFILTVAFSPASLGTPAHPGAVMTWGVVIGASILSFGFVLTAIYVVYANRRFDALSRRIQEDLK